MWWHKPRIPALVRLRQENCEFQASLDYIAIHCIKKTKAKKQKSKQERRKAKEKWSVVYAHFSTGKMLVYKPTKFILQILYKY
jgi:hypothetical protein